VIVSVLFVVEFRAIDQDRFVHDQEQAKARAEETKNFHDIGDGIKQSIQESQRQFDATMKSMKGLLSETTGGNSYIYFDVASVSGPVEIELPGTGLQKGAMIVSLVRVFNGQYPLHNVYVSVFGPHAWGPQIEYGTIFPNEQGKPFRVPELQFLPDQPRQYFNLWISTSHESYRQVIFVQKFAGKWLWASRLYKGAAAKPFRVWAAKGFPKEQLDSNWDK